jgi:formate dehydrogenase major subunit
MSEIHLVLNGQPVTAHSGQTILEAAQAVGIDIPTLCHHPVLSNHGACRICLVEVKGMRGFQTACTCPVTEGMDVQTETEKIIEGRKFALELLFAERNHYCMYCQVSGDCELQDLAYRYGLDHWRYPRSFERIPLDASHPYIIMEPNRCILCTRCVRACAEIAFSHTLGLRERGSDSMIMADVNLPLGTSTCVGCGACLQVCPTGALIDSLSAYGGHEEDLTHTQTTCIQCSVGCTLDVVTRENRLLRVEGVWGAGPSGGLLCVDGRFKPLYEKRCRITKPRIRRNGKLMDADWDDALDLVAKRLKNGSAFGLAACVTTNEALEAFTGLFEHAGWLETAVPELGYGKPARLCDIQVADFIVVVGADPLNNQRVVGYFIKRAVDQGAHLALIDHSENGLRDVATMTGTYDDANAIVEQAVHAARVVIVYGAGLKPETITALKPLADKALFLALEPARNGKVAQAVKLAPAEIQDADTLFFLLGEQEEDDSVIGQLNAAFTIVQASYSSPLAERADVVLPAPIWAERSGHFTNLEGEVLPLKAVVPMPTGVRDDAEVLRVLAKMM